MYSNKYVTINCIALRYNTCGGLFPISIMPFLLVKTVSLFLTILQIRPPELDKDVRCFFVDHNDPFLILGPFKYELKNRVPEIGLFHDLASK